MEKDKITEYAKGQGYDGAEYLKKWKGWDVYEPTMEEGDFFAGLPLVILVKGNRIRMSTPEECLKI